MKKSKNTNKTKFSWKKEKKALQNGGYSIVLTVIVLAAAIMANKIVSEIPSKYTQFDISTGKLYTIGDETNAVLKDLDKDIEIYYIVQKGNEDNNIEKLLNLYEEGSKHIKVEKKDPVVFPSFTKNYTADEVSENSLIVVCGERSKTVSYSNIYESTVDYNTYQQSVTGFDGEGQITSALTFVTSGNLSKVYAIEGHNEVAVPETIKERIEKANVEIENLSLLTQDSVPADACALMLNAPASDYSAEETEKILNYLDQGGRAIIVSDFMDKDMPNFNSILLHYGVETVSGVVVESDANHYVQKPYYLVPSIEYSDITQDMLNGSAYVLISGCQGFRVPEAAENEESAATIQEFLKTSDKALLKTNPSKMQTYEKEDGDEEGQFAIGVTVSKAATKDQADAKEENGSESASKETRVAAFASSTVFDESLNNSVADGNYTVFMNAMNWLVDSPEASVTSIPSKSMSMTMLTVTAAKGIILSLIICFVLPFACLVVGGVVCIRRRRL